MALLFHGLVADKFVTTFSSSAVFSAEYPVGVRLPYATKSDIISAMTYQEERIIQVLDYLADNIHGKRLSKLNALKLVYLADRYHLRKYASPILWDTYYAMQYGPVASTTKKLIEELFAAQDGKTTEYISVTDSGKRTRRGEPILIIDSKKKPDLTQLSKTEREALNVALSQWPLHDDLVDYTHFFPEWKAAEDNINAGATRIRMRYADFFLPCKRPSDEFCNVPQDVVDLNKEVFLEDASFRNFRV